MIKTILKKKKCKKAKWLSEEVLQIAEKRREVKGKGEKERYTPGESRGGSRAAAPVCGLSRGTTARSVSLSWGAREVGSPCEWRGGARHCSRVMVGESGLEMC